MKGSFVKKQPIPHQGLDQVNQLCWSEKGCQVDFGSFQNVDYFLNFAHDQCVHYRNAIHLSKSVCFHCMVRVTNFLMGRYTANIYNQITIMSERLQPGYYNLVIVVLLTTVLVVKLKSNLFSWLLFSCHPIKQTKWLMTGQLGMHGHLPWIFV